MSLSLSIHSTDLEALEADVLVLGVLKGSDGAYLAPSSLSEDSVEGINELLEALGASVPPISCCVCPVLRTPVPALWRWQVWALILLRVRNVWTLCVTRLVLRLVSWLVPLRRLLSISVFLR